jgi:hypothetical protein
VKPTVLRHFEWMKDYGIDGVWVQRFASQLGESRRRRKVNAVLSHCREGANTHGRSFAVIFPGFSWTNLKRGKSPLNHIPRLGGRFLWSQAELVRDYGMDMVYIAMFDEVDEGTAIFKCTNRPPQGRFVTYEGYPSDHYLELSGRIGPLLRGEAVAFPETRPDR